MPCSLREIGRTRADRWVLGVLTCILLLPVALFGVVAYLSQNQNAALDNCLWNRPPGATGAQVERKGAFPPRYECRYDEYDEKEAPGPSRLPR
jgi:hypothetical protein